MKNKCFYLSLLLLIAVFVPLMLGAVPKAYSAANPFLTPQTKHSQQEGSGTQPEHKSRFSKNAAPAEQTPSLETHKTKPSSIYSRIMAKVSILQKEIRAELTGFARGIKKDPYGKSLWMFLAFSFVYGIVHAVGPGHGKSVVCAYFISRPGSMSAASFMSWLITLVHVGSATATVCLAYFLFQTGMSGFESFNRHLQSASFGLVTLIGLWLTIGALRSFVRKDSGEDECSQVSQCSFKEIATVAFVTGIVPCPGAAIILVYSLSTGILSAGLLAMVFLATGMAVTTSLFAFTAAKARCLVDKTSASGWATRLYSLLSLCGGLVILGFGALMLAAHLS